MYKANKSFSIMSLVIGLVVFVLTVFTSPVTAVDLPFDPNDYTFLVYNPGGSEPSIIAAMEKIIGRQLAQSEIRTYSNPVTPNDLATHDILIVGWNSGGSTSGLHSDDLLAGITGRVVLSGHDLDFHTAPPAGYESRYREAAQKMLIQTINYVLSGGAVFRQGIDIWSRSKRIVKRKV